MGTSLRCQRWDLTTQSGKLNVSVSPNEVVYLLLREGLASCGRSYNKLQQGRRDNVPIPKCRRDSWFSLSRSFC